YNSVAREISNYLFSKALMMVPNITEVATALHEDDRVAVDHFPHLGLRIRVQIAAIGNLSIHALEESQLAKPYGAVSDIGIVWNVDESAFAFRGNQISQGTQDLRRSRPNDCGSSGHAACGGNATLGCSALSRRKHAATSRTVGKNPSRQIIGATTRSTD